MTEANNIQKKQSFIFWIAYKYIKLIRVLEKFLTPILMIVIRLLIARIFFYSGLTKISSWSSTIFLFKYEYKVPAIPPEIAALIATGAELTCPILLVIGLATRIATLPLLAMVIVIQLTYDNISDHYYWMTLLFVLFLHGPGSLSLDCIIKRKLARG